MLRCDNDIHVKENCVEMTDVANVKCEFGKNIFQKTTDDEKIWLSIDDRDFLEIMDSQFHKIPKDSEKLPYLFAKIERDWLITVNKLLIGLSNSLHVLWIMDQLVQKHHAKVAPPSEYYLISNMYIDANYPYLGSAKAYVPPYSHFCYFDLFYRKWKQVFYLFFNNNSSGQIQ